MNWMTFCVGRSDDTYDRWEDQVAQVAPTCCVARPKTSQRNQRSCTLTRESALQSRKAGVGIVFRCHETTGQLMVHALNDWGAAQASGKIREGDILLQVSNEDVSGAGKAVQPVQLLARLIPGDVGSKVELTFQRRQHVFTVELMRRHNDVTSQEFEECIRGSHGNTSSESSGAGRGWVSRSDLSHSDLSRSEGALSSSNSLKTGASLSSRSSSHHLSSGSEATAVKASSTSAAAATSAARDIVSTPIRGFFR